GRPSGRAELSAARADGGGVLRKWRGTFDSTETLSGRGRCACGFGLVGRGPLWAVNLSRGTIGRRLGGWTPSGGAVVSGRWPAGPPGGERGSCRDFRRFDV